MEIRHGHAPVNGLNLHYAAAGSGPLMLFVHGFPEFWYEWKAQLPEFGRDHLAVAPDMRGYNLSDKPEKVEDYAVPHLVADIGGLADHFGAARFTLVAHDWGAAAAFAFALTHPQRVERLIIINGTHPAPFARDLATSPAQIRASQYMRLFRTPGAEQVLMADNFAFMRERFGLLGRGVFTAEDEARYLEAWSRPGALTGGLNWYRAARFEVPPEGETRPSPTLDPARLTVRVPTLMIWGEKDDALLPGLLDGIEAWIPDLVLHRIPHGTHWVIHEEPQLINRLIRDWLASRTPAPA